MSTFLRLQNRSEVKMNCAPSSPKSARGRFNLTMFLVMFEFCRSLRFGSESGPSSIYKVVTDLERLNFTSFCSKNVI